MVCEICERIEKGKDFRIYEDNLIVAFLEKKPSAYGHIIIAPKQHLPIFENYDDKTVSHIFNVGNKLSSVLFDSLNIHGTNIIVNNGVAAGQKCPHFLVHVIPRIEKDGLRLEWQPKKLSDDEMVSAEMQLKSAAKNVAVVKEEKKEIIEDKRPKLIIQKDKSEEENYLIKHLRRIP